MVEYFLDSVEDALKLARRFRKQGRADAFRGQNAPWVPIPSLLRMNGTERPISEERLAKFVDWAQFVPLLRHLNRDEDSYRAVAQHYGIATTLLDFSEDPDVAAFFALDGYAPSADGNPVIYCLKTHDISNIRGARVIRIDVANLWRLEAQRGLFIEVDSQDAGRRLEQSCIKIYFPPSMISYDTREKYYPIRKSSLEIVLDQFFTKEIHENISNKFDTKISIRFRWRSYVGAFLNREWAKPDHTWLDIDPHWTLTDRIKFDATCDKRTFSIDVPSTSDLVCLKEALSDQYQTEIAKLWEERTLVDFCVTAANIEEIELTEARKLLNIMWDGLVTLPYSAAEIVNCVCLTVTLLMSAISEHAATHEGKGCGIDRLLGETTAVEFAPFNGAHSGGTAATDALQQALSPDIRNVLSPYVKRHVLMRPLRVLDFVLDHVAVFRFDEFKRVFCEQVIPSQFYWFFKEHLGLLKEGGATIPSWVFDPVAIGYFSTSNYRFGMPFALEADPDRILYIFEDMTDEELVDPT